VQSPQRTQQRRTQRIADATPATIRPSDGWQRGIGGDASMHANKEKEKERAVNGISAVGSPHCYEAACVSDDRQSSQAAIAQRAPRHRSPLYAS